jgi:hypothetical protein
MPATHSQLGRPEPQNTTHPINKRKGKNTNPYPFSKHPIFLEPIMFQRLTWPVVITTPKGSIATTALFDTGSNVFVLNYEWA